MRNNHPNLKWKHFVSPSYFLPGNESNLRQMLKSVKDDEHIALYLSGRHDVVQAAGVKFRHRPTFWGNQIAKDSCLDRCGIEVPLSVYTTDELTTIVGYSKQLLDDQELTAVDSYMVSGWMSTNAVRQAAASVGLAYDYSPVAYNLLRSKMKYVPLYAWLKSHWSQITPFSQPHRQLTTSHVTTLIPNNLAGFDYLQPRSLLDIIRSYINVWRQDRHKSFVLSTGLLQEQLIHTAHHVSTLVVEIENLLEAKRIPYAFTYDPREHSSPEKPTRPLSSKSRPNANPWTF